MNRPWVIWIVLVGCALLIVGALGLFTDRIVGMERERTRVEAEAEIEERVRLALSRMDAAASGILVIENQRPPLHFEAFYSPDDILTNAYQNVGKELVLRPSPLLEACPEFIRLHFEIRSGMVMSSPQVPVGNQRDLAEASGMDGKMLDRCAADLEGLRAMLAESAAEKGAVAGAGTNFEYLTMACMPAHSAWNRVEVAEVEQKASWMADQRQKDDNSLQEEAQYQKEMSYVEQGRRAQVLEKTQERAAQGAMKKVQWGKSEVAAVRGAKAAPAVVEEEVTTFRPIWLGGELFAVRRVVDENGARYQGIWLQTATLKEYLLESSEDLVPKADLSPVKALVVESLEGAFDVGLATLQSEPRALVTLPWRLEAGETVAVKPLAWTPLRISLLLGWITVILALFAAAGLLRGVMKMSERRAAFVSSVTHELRTPLTTFQLYSDMLAGGMVQDEEKRQGYLDTLCLEAGRLNHLIENVLAYSRIERGSARAKHEKLSVADLLSRFERRVRERVQQEHGAMEVCCGENCGEVELETDVTAVEQIVFNLVDNACKYGMEEDGSGRILLKAEVVGRKARFSVCDEGCGIDRKDLKKLFRPFHKSAKEAAHSKPGVGLGLALSRRLARALGGELAVEKREGDGACFVLELPVGR